MRRTPPRSTLTDPLCPDTPLFRSTRGGAPAGEERMLHGVTQEWLIAGEAEQCQIPQAAPEFFDAALAAPAHCNQLGQEGIVIKADFRSIDRTSTRLNSSH